MVRQATPSAWPSSSRLGFCSTMQVLMSGKAASDDQHVDFSRNRS
jgi:hypothetical protein